MEDELLSVKEKDKEVTKEPKKRYRNQAEELRYSIAALLAENDVFERHLGRLHLQNLQLQDEGERPKTAEDSQLAEGGVEREQQISSNLQNHSQLLTLEQKLHVVQKEVNDTEQDQKKLQLKYEKILDNYKASVKEAELRLAEIWKAKKKFEQGPLKSLKNRQQEMEPEKVLQCIKDRSKVIELEKFTLMNQTLKFQVKKLLQQIHQKKEPGHADHETSLLEFEKPRGGKSLKELQHSNFEIQRALSLHKDKLQSVTLNSTELSKQIAKRNQMLAKMEEGIQQAEKGCLKAERLNEHLREELTDYQVPDVTEYINAKDKQKKLRHSIHTWERKVDIAEMVLKMSIREEQAQSHSNSCKQRRIWK